MSYNFMEEGGIYIHVPFCRNKCLYCDFYSAGSRIADWNAYEEAVVNEFHERKDEIGQIPTTFYIGGGTPSLMPLKNMERIVETINKGFGKFLWKEFTLEVNPEDVTKDNSEQWKKIGVNRVSIGIQSLNDTELKKIGRRHDSLEGIEAIQILKEDFDNISVDIMFGLPGQTIESYKDTLERIIDLDPTHISSYSLMLEKGTAMTLLAEKERIILPEEEEWLNMYRLTTSFLKRAGYRRYEISNYSLPGRESKHNSNYWLGKPYLGLGPGAHSYDGAGIRRGNPYDLKGYLKRFSENKDTTPFYNEEILTDVEIQEEYVMTRLRTVNGIGLTDFERNFGKNEMGKLLNKVESYLRQGNIKKENGRIFLTDEGFKVFDTILSSLI